MQSTSNQSGKAPSKPKQPTAKLNNNQQNHKATMQLIKHKPTKQTTKPPNTKTHKSQTSNQTPKALKQHKNIKYQSIATNP